MKNQIMDKQTIFCVTGMHRTGSSLFTQWLNHNGVFIGRELLGSATTNKYGHFEDMDFLKLHVDELNKNGLHPSGLYGDLTKIRPSHEFFVTAEKLVQARAGMPVWTWKEPRTTLFLKYWKEVIPDLQVVILERDQEKIVTSLYKRFKKDKWYVTRNPLKKMRWHIDIDLQPKKWYRRFGKICEQYAQSWKEVEKDHPNDFVVLSINEFLHNHEIQVARVNRQLGLALPDDTLREIYDDDILH